MKNSRSLHINGIYSKLIWCDIPKLIVGYEQLHYAFQNLATFEGDAKELTEVKEVIVIVLVMFFEGPQLLVKRLTNELRIHCVDFLSLSLGRKMRP